MSQFDPFQIRTAFTHVSRNVSAASERPLVHPFDVAQLVPRNVLQHQLGAPQPQSPRNDVLVLIVDTAVVAADAGCRTAIVGTFAADGGADAT